MDGVIYGIAASLGFAAYENIEYVLYFEKNPSFDIALVRAFTAIPIRVMWNHNGFFNLPKYI